VDLPLAEADISAAQRFFEGGASLAEVFGLLRRELTALGTIDRIRVIRAITGASIGTATALVEAFEVGRSLLHLTCELLARAELPRALSRNSYEFHVYGFFRDALIWGRSELCVREDGQGLVYWHDLAGTGEPNGSISAAQRREDGSFEPMPLPLTELSAAFAQVAAKDPIFASCCERVGETHQQLQIRWTFRAAPASESPP
jgi:hypothetical protein